MKRFRLVFLAVALVVGLLTTASFASALRGEKQAVTGLTISWEIIKFSPLPPRPPFTFNPGGVASALDPNGSKITLTGSGNFGGPPKKVTGGGNWTTYAASGAQSGSGTYKVVSLISFIQANFQSQTPTVIDNTGDTSKRANGTAVLRIAYSDGSQGVLTVGCHGPGAPDGMFEGIAATKGFKTYYTVPAPAPTTDEGRTIFHVGV